MNQRLDSSYYLEFKESFETDRLHQIKVLQTRILKLPMSNLYGQYLEIGRELFNLGQFQKSIFPLRRATIINPSDYKAPLALAKAFLQLKKDDEAFLAIKKALSLDPQNLSLHRFLVETLEEKHRLEDLEIFCKEVIDLIADPTEIPSFYFENAEALIRCKNYPQALKSYKKAVENNSTDHYHYYNYGLTLYREGFFEEAIVQFENVKKIDPSVRLAWNSVAHLHYCLGRVEKAREEFEYIIANGLGSHVTYSNFLLVLHHLGEGEEVMNKYKNLLKPYVQSHRYVLPNLYNEELRITKNILNRDNIEEKTKEFNTKKVEAINFVLSLLQ